MSGMCCCHVGSPLVSCPSIPHSWMLNSGNSPHVSHSGFPAFCAAFNAVASLPYLTGLGGFLERVCLSVVMSASVFIESVIQRFQTGRIVECA